MTRVTTIKPDLFIGDTTYPKGSVLELPDDRALALVEQGAVAFVDAPKHTLEGTKALRAKLSELP